MSAKEISAPVKRGAAAAIAPVSGRPCPSKNCRNFISPRSRLDTCPLCRSNILNWDRAPLPKVRQRRRNLERYTDRMEHVRKGRED